MSVYVVRLESAGIETRAIPVKKRTNLLNEGRPGDGG